MKFKTKLQNSYRVIKARGAFREKIDQEELEQFAQKNIQGFFKPKMIKKKCIKYIGIPCMPLAGYLNQPINRHDFFNIMEQFVSAARGLWENGFTTESVVSDISHVYINGMTKEIQLIYLPTLTNKTQNSFIELMETVVYTSSSSEKNTDYINYFIQFIRNLGSVQKESIEKLENYIANEGGSANRKLSGTDRRFEGGMSNSGLTDGSEDKNLTYFQEAIQEERDTEVVNDERYSYLQRGTSSDFNNSKLDYSYFRRGASGRNQENSNIIPEENERIMKSAGDGFKGVERNKMPDDGEIRPSENTLMSDEQEVAADKKARTPDVDDNNTSMLGGDRSEDTDFLNTAQEEITRNPVLYRISTGERIPLPPENKVFRLGKEKGSVDYAIPDNHAVSRSHADIIRRDNKYYVFDLGSKNKTYINNRALPSQYEVEINNGDILKLANEEFEFRWQ